MMDSRNGQIHTIRKEAYYGRFHIITYTYTYTSPVHRNDIYLCVFTYRLHVTCAYTYEYYGQGCEFNAFAYIFFPLLQRIRKRIRSIFVLRY